MSEEYPNVTCQPIPGQPKNLRFEQISSLAELGELAEMHRIYDMDREGGLKWCGGSWSNALDMAAHGWDEPLPDVDALVDNLAEQLTFAPMLDVSGCEVDMDRYLVGEAECMLDYPLQSKAIRSASILVPVCYSAIVSEEAIRKRGVAVAAALEELRKQGTAVTVIAYVMIAGRVGDKRYQARDSFPISVSMITMADTRVAYDLARITYGVGHPTMLRQIFFAYEDGWDAIDRDVFGIEGNGGRGYSPYSLPTGPEDVREWVTSQLETEVTISLPEITANANRWSVEEHMEYIEGFFTQDGRVDEE